MEGATEGYGYVQGGTAAAGWAPVAHAAPTPSALLGPPPTLVTPRPNLLRALLRGSIVPLIFLAGVTLASWPDDVGEARALVEDVDGDEVTVQLVDQPQPNRFVVEWAGDDVRPGQAIEVDLGGRCRCEPIPVDRGPAIVGLLIGIGFAAVLWLLLGGTQAVALITRRRAMDRAQGAADLPQTLTAVWIRPRWQGRRPLVLHLDVHERETGRRIGRVLLGAVTIEMDPWVPYTLLQRGMAFALRSDDGRHLILPAGPLEPYPPDEKVSPLSEAADEAMRWGSSRRDPAWARAHGRALGLARILSIGYIAIYLGLLFLVDSPFVTLQLACVTAILLLARRFTRRPLTRLVQERTEARGRDAGTVAVAVLATLLPAVAVTDRDRLA